MTRQNIPVFDRTKTNPAAGLLKGGYTLWDSKAGSTPDIILIGTGSELALAYEAGQIIAAEGKSVRVVSLPCWELFNSQPQAYQDSVLPPAVTRRVGVEAGVELGWQKYIGQAGKFVGVATFGASAPYERLQKEYGLTTEHVLEVAKSLL
jgi:transketolase